MHSIEWWHFQWPWVTFDPDFKVTVLLKANISKTVHLRDTYGFYKPYPIPNLSNGTTFNDLEWPLTRISRSLYFWSRISEISVIVKDKLLLHINRKLYSAYGMVLCFVWWPRLTSEGVAWVCQHQLSLFRLIALSCAVYCNRPCLSVCLWV